MSQALGAGRSLGVLESYFLSVPLRYLGVRDLKRYTACSSAAEPQLQSTDTSKRTLMPTQALVDVGMFSGRPPRTPRGARQDG